MKIAVVMCVARFLFENRTAGKDYLADFLPFEGGPHFGVVSSQRHNGDVVGGAQQMGVGYDHFSTQPLGLGAADLVRSRKVKPEN
jgi:hypothetical protein